MNKILLVDDDRELTSLLKELLEMEGFNVIVAHDGEQALDLLDDSIDLLLLDVMMPKKNGIDTLKALRQTHQTPVIMLTARGSELDRVLGLELGADDYLPKPFNDRELVARIRAILRRSHWSEQQQNNDNGSPTLEVDALVLNPGRQEASFDGQTLELTGTEFTLLYLLAQHLGQVVSREHLSQEVLGKRLTPFDRAIDMHISNLRRKLPDRKSGTLVVTKIAVAWVVAAIASRIIPEHGVEVGFFAGLSTLALVAAMDMTNGGLYASIMQQYGTKEEAGAFVLMSLESGPLMTMIILGTAGIASFEPHVFVGAVLPFLVGFALGNLDPELREFFSKAVQTLIPFFAFALGNTIDLTVIAQTGLLGILLGVAVIIVTGIPLIIADKFIGGGDGTAGIAASSSAGAAVATPVLIAEMVPFFRPFQNRLWLA